MEEEKNTPTPLEEGAGQKKNMMLPMSEETKKRLQAIAEQLKGRELFPEAMARARAMFKGLKP